MIIKTGNDDVSNYNSNKNDDNNDNKIDLINFIKNNRNKILIIGGLLIIVILIFLIMFLNDKNNESIDTSYSYYIELLGEEEITIYQDDSYVEMGYEAYDNKGVDFSSQVIVDNMVDVSMVGEYYVTYSLYDTSVKRKVTVVEKPVGATVIYLKGTATIYIKLGEPYIELGYKVTDSVDGNLYDKVIVSGSVDVNKAGIYKIIYSVTNNSGVTTSKERTVVVMDSDISLKVDNTNYTNKSVTIDIYVMNNLFDYLVVPDGSKITDKDYSYTVSENGEYKFMVYDKNGDVTEKSITISNIDREEPSGSCSATISSGKTYIDISAYDNVGIKKYVIDGDSYTLKNITLNKEMDKVEVTIYDVAGNGNSVNCTAIRKGPEIVSVTNNNSIITVKAKSDSSKIVGYYFATSKGNVTGNESTWVIKNEDTFKVGKLPGVYYVYIKDSDGVITGGNEVEVTISDLYDNGPLSRTGKNLLHQVKCTP